MLKEINVQSGMRLYLRYKNTVFGGGAARFTFAEEMLACAMESRGATTWKRITSQARMGVFDICVCLRVFVRGDLRGDLAHGDDGHKLVWSHFPGRILTSCHSLEANFTPAIHTHTHTHNLSLTHTRTHQVTELMSAFYGCV